MKWSPAVSSVITSSLPKEWGWVGLASPKLQVGTWKAALSAHASWSDVDDLKCPCECGPSSIAGRASSNRRSGLLCYCIKDSKRRCCINSHPCTCESISYIIKYCTDAALFVHMAFRMFTAWPILAISPPTSYMLSRSDGFWTGCRFYASIIGNQAQRWHSAPVPLPKWQLTNQLCEQVITDYFKAAAPNHWHGDKLESSQISHFYPRHD